jgi:hypothetical protein
MNSDILRLAGHSDGLETTGPAYPAFRRHSPPHEPRNFRARRRRVRRAGPTRLSDFERNRSSIRCHFPLAIVLEMRDAAGALGVAARTTVEPSAVMRGIDS